MVGIVESVGPEVSSVRPGDRVAVNVETLGVQFDVPKTSFKTPEKLIKTRA